MPLIIGNSIAFPDSFEPSAILKNTNFIFVIAKLATAIALLYFSVSFMFVFYFCFFYKLNAWQSLKMSYKFIRKSWWSFFKLYFLSSILLLAGLMCFGIGILVSIPIIRLVGYKVFAQVTDF